MNRDELLQLRKDTVDKTRQLALKGVDDPTSRLQVLMGLVRSGDASKDMMNQIAEVIEQIPDEEKLDAYLEFIYEIDMLLGDDLPPDNHDA